MSTLAERLKAALGFAGLSGAELAERAGVSQPYVSQLLSGAREQPSRETADRLAHAIGAGISAHYLLGKLAPREEIRISEALFRYLSRPQAAIKGGTHSSGRKRGRQKPNKRPDPTTLFGGKRTER